MTPALPNRMTILLADDDQDDCLLVRDALVAGGVVGSLRTVGDGEELLNYLNRRGTFSAEASNQDEDGGRSYDLGASSFVTKPVTFEALVGVMKTIGQYWFEVVELPGP